MERLTYKNHKGEWAVKRTEEYEIVNVYSSENGTCYIGGIIDRLAELEDKFENGLALDLTEKRQPALISRENNLGCPMIGIFVTEEELETLIDNGIVELPY